MDILGKFLVSPMTLGKHSTLPLQSKENAVVILQAHMDLNQVKVLTNVEH